MGRSSERLLGAAFSSLAPRLLCTTLDVQHSRAASHVCPALAGLAPRRYGAQIIDFVKIKLTGLAFNLGPEFVYKVRTLCCAVVCSALCRAHHRE